MWIAVHIFYHTITRALFIYIIILCVCMHGSIFALVLYMHAYLSIRHLQYCMETQIVLLGLFHFYSCVYTIMCM